MENKQTASIPGAIIIAGAIIAVAIIWSNKPMMTAPTANESATAQAAAIVLAPVTNGDHILGNPAAPIKIVEYSDTSCPYCKILHPTLQKLAAAYGSSGNVAWVYRHLPLHENSENEATATECAASLGGNDAFWKFTNRLYEVTQTDKGIQLDQSKIPEIATYAGLEATAFAQCMTSGRFVDKIAKDKADAMNAGITGTPGNILLLNTPAPKSIDAIVADMALKYPGTITLSDDRLKIRIMGALPENVFTTILDALIKQ